MTLEDLLKVNHINNVVIFTPDHQFPESFGAMTERKYTCCAREALDSRKLCKEEVDAIYLSPENMLQIVLKPQEEDVKKARDPWYKGKEE